MWKGASRKSKVMCAGSLERRAAGGRELVIITEGRRGRRKGAPVWDLKMWALVPMPWRPRIRIVLGVLAMLLSGLERRLGGFGSGVDGGECLSSPRAQEGGENEAAQETGFGAELKSSMRGKNLRAGGCWSSGQELPG